MDTKRGSTTANISSLSCDSASSTSISTPKIKNKGNLKKRGKSFGSNSAHSTPDLDIVSGFAFLSFSNLEDLECHIEEHEVKTQSLSINVGQKRKKQPKNEENIEKLSDETISVRCTSKRVRIPSQKILESFATNDIPIRHLIPSNDSQSKLHGKTKSSPDEKLNDTNVAVNFLHSNVKNEATKKNIFPSCITESQNLETKDSDISLECSETLDVCMFDEEDVRGSLPTPSSLVTEVPQKKQKKKKRKRNINDQTCQTMFRIKKKKQTKTLSDSTASSSKEGIHSNSVGVSRASQEESNPTEDPKLENKDELPSDVEVKEEKNIFTPAEQYQQMQATKYFDIKYPRPTYSNKVEKINYCARSGGLNLVERHHQRQSVLKEIDAAGNSTTQRSQCDKDSQDSCDTSIQSDNYLSDNSSNESALNSLQDQEGLPSNKNRIFAGSSSVFMSPEEPDEENEVEIGCDIEESDTFPVNIVKALPKNYLFGHYSTYPDKTTNGTIDVNIQIYENDIQLYMNYASDFNGKIIKIITPDNEESSKNTNSCLPHSASYSGVPKFLQPQEYVKAVRSATERNRRHNLGDLFNILKNEIFDDVEEFHFSKQAILSKALEVLSREVQQNVGIIKEKTKLMEKNKDLRKNLNVLLFGKDHDLQNKQVDLDKVNEFLKSLSIEIKIPDKSSESSSAKDDTLEGQSSKNVTKKGRPPLEGKFALRKKHVMSPPSPSVSYLKPPNPKQCAENTKCENVEANKIIKGFIAIAPSNTESKVIPCNKEKIETETNDKGKAVACNQTKTDEMDMAPVSKIVCNLSRYRLQQRGESKGMTFVTNPEPLKTIDSKNVLHIKISNDTMKHVGCDEVTNNNVITLNVHGDTNLNHGSKSLPQSKSLSTQTDIDEKQPSTDCNANALEPGQQVMCSCVTTSSTNPISISQSKSLLPKQPMVTTTKKLNAPESNGIAVVNSQGKRLLPKPSALTATVSVSNPLGKSSKNVYLVPKLPAIAPTPSNIQPPGRQQNVMLLSKPNTTVATTSTVINMVKPILTSTGSSQNVLLVPQPCTTGVATTTVDTIKPTVKPIMGTVLLSRSDGGDCIGNPLESSQNLLLQPIPCGNTATTTNVNAAKSSGNPSVSALLPKPVAVTTSGIALKPTAALKRLVDILKGRTITTTNVITTVAKPQTDILNSEGVTTKPTFTIASPQCVSKANTPHQTVQNVVASSHSTVVQVTNNVQSSGGHVSISTAEVKPTTLLQTGLPLSNPVTMTTTEVPMASPTVNMFKQGAGLNSLDQRYVTVIPSASASTSVPSSSAVRIIFKPTGKPIRTPGALQHSSRLIRLPVAQTTAAQLQGSIPAQQNNPPPPTTTNYPQAPNLKFLLQNGSQVLRQPNTNVPLQHNTAIAQSQLQNSIRATSPQIKILKPLVRIQPLQSLPQNLSTAKQVIAPLSSNNLTMSVQPLQANNGVSTASSVGDSIVNQPKQQVMTYTPQSVLSSGNVPGVGVRNQHFNQISPKSMILPATQSGMGAGPFVSTVPFQANSKQTNPLNVTPKTGTPSLSPVGPKKTIFSEMEKMVAKIPLPELQSSGNNAANTVSACVTTPSCSQGLSLTSQIMGNTCTNIDINSNALQISTSPSSVRPAAQTSETSVLQSKGCLIAEGRATIQSSIPSTSTQTIVTHSLTSACSSGATFQVSEPKQHDKTCSVVESPEDNSHVVTAAALSVCNIDSTIPDIKNEIQGNQSNSSVTDRLFVNSTEQNLNDPCGNIDEKQENSPFVGQDESTAEDFDLLASLDSVQQCF